MPSNLLAPITAEELKADLLRPIEMSEFHEIGKPERNITREQGVDPKTRLLLQNLAKNSPELQLKYLKDRGQDAVIAPSGQVAIVDPKTGSLNPVDPEDGLDWQDVTDYLLTAAEAGTVGAATAYAGPAGAVMAGGSFERGKQYLQQAAGMRPDILAPGEMAARAEEEGRAALGAGAAAVVGGVVGKGLSAVGRKGAELETKAGLTNLNLPKAEVSRITPSQAISKFQSEIEEFGTSSPEIISAKVTPRVHALNQQIEDKLSLITGVVDSGALTENIVNDVSKISQGMLAKDKQKLAEIISKELPEYNVSGQDLWFVAKRLRAKAIETGDTNLSNAAEEIQKSVPQLASQLGDQQLAEDMQLYYKLEMIRQQAENKIASGISEGGSLSIPHIPTSIMGAAKALIKTPEKAVIKAGQAARKIQDISSGSKGILSPTSTIELGNPYSAIHDSTSTTTTREK